MPSFSHPCSQILLSKRVFKEKNNDMVKNILKLIKCQKWSHPILYSFLLLSHNHWQLRGNVLCCASGVILSIIVQMFICCQPGIRCAHLNSVRFGSAFICITVWETEDLVSFFSYFMSTLVCPIEFTFKKLPNPTRIWVPPSPWCCPLSNTPLPSPPCLLLWKSDTQFWEEGPGWPKGHPA